MRRTKMWTARSFIWALVFAFPMTLGAEPKAPTTPLNGNVDKLSKRPRAPDRRPRPKIERPNGLRLERNVEGRAEGFLVAAGDGVIKLEMPIGTTTETDFRRFKIAPEGPTDVMIARRTGEYVRLEMQRDARTGTFYVVDVKTVAIPSHVTAKSSIASSGAP